MQSCNAADLRPGHHRARAGVSAPVRADSLTVKTAQGKVHGKTINDGKVRAFLGLPYAAPPVGDLRWKAPEPPANWKGVRDATRYGARCMQAQIYTDMVFQDTGPSEDCLFLNVFTPAAPSAESKLPVMFWIHGGGTLPAPPPSPAITATSCPSRAWCWSPSTTGSASSAFWPRPTWPKRPAARQGTTA